MAGLIEPLLALVGVRWKSDLRSFLRGRERIVGLLFAIPGLLLASGFTAVFVWLGSRALERGWPEATLPLLSALATGVGVLWALSPLITGVAFTEAHDVSKLLQFPLPSWLLVVSSLLANLLQPMVLAELPVLVALAFGLGGGAAGALLALPGLLLSFALLIVASHLAQLGLTGLARDRRFQDLALGFGLGFAVLLSVLPVLLLAAGGRRLKPVLGWLVDHDLFAWSPFGFGVRSAVHLVRGDLLSGAVWTAAAAVAAISGVLVAGVLAERIFRGELTLSGPPGGRNRVARQWLPGAFGALVEKDLRLAWRDPAVKVALVASLVGPAVMLILFSQSLSGRPAGSGVLLALSVFVGLGGHSNAFGFERRGILLLFGFPVDRMVLLLGKTTVAFVLRLPSLLLVALAAPLLADVGLVPVALAGSACVGLVSQGFDAWISVLFPQPVPAAGRNPYGGAGSGSRGLASAWIGLACLPLTLAISAPFVFLAWLPVWLESRLLFLGSVPLALAGALGAHALIVAGAARTLRRREPELIERVLAEV